jgi:hypothetical protein
MFNRNKKKKEELDLAMRTKTSQFLLSPLTIYGSIPKPFFMFGKSV